MMVLPSRVRIARVGSGAELLPFSVLVTYCQTDSVWGIVAWTKSRSPSRGGELMSKGMDRKKEGKKKPAKSLQEKRAAKREKKQSRGFQV
jgi:hypothetical protein